MKQQLTFVICTAAVVGLLMPGACVGFHWLCRDEVETGGRRYRQSLAFFSTAQTAHSRASTWGIAARANTAACSQDRVVSYCTVAGHCMPCAQCPECIPKGHILGPILQKMLIIYGRSQITLLEKYHRLTLPKPNAVRRIKDETQERNFSSEKDPPRRTDSDRVQDRTRRQRVCSLPLFGDMGWRRLLIRRSGFI